MFAEVSEQRRSQVLCGKFLGGLTNPLFCFSWCKKSHNVTCLQLSEPHQDSGCFFFFLAIKKHSYRDFIFFFFFLSIIGAYSIKRCLCPQVPVVPITAA